MTRPLFDAWMPKKGAPGWLRRASSAVSISKARAVQALLMAMSMAPMRALSMRACATRLPPTSTTAMFIGQPMVLALASAASMTLRAVSRLTVGISVQPFERSVRIAIATDHRYLRNDAFHALVDRGDLQHGPACVAGAPDADSAAVYLGQAAGVGNRVSDKSRCALLISGC